MHGDEMSFWMLVGLVVFTTGWGVVASWMARRFRDMWEEADADAQAAHDELRRVSERTMQRHQARAEASRKGWKTRKAVQAS